MKILHVLGDRYLPRHANDEGSSGVVRVALEFARVQANKGYDVSVAVVGKQAWRSEWQGVHLRQLQAASWARLQLNGRVLDFRLHVPYIALTHQQRFDIVHGHLYSYMRFLPARRRVAHFHTDPFYKGSKNEGIDLKPADFLRIAQSSDAQIAISHFVGKELERGFGKLGNVHVVHNGIDLQRFDAQRLQEARLQHRQQWGIPDDAVVFLFAGAIVPEKGVMHLARAFVELLAQMPHIYLALAGSNQLWSGAVVAQGKHQDYEEEVRRVLHEPVTNGHVQLLGGVPASAMPSVYATSDVVVVPSVWREGFGLVALEGLAAGCPVIASNTGGLVEIVNEGNGILVPPGDETALIAAMRALASDPTRRTQLGQQAQLDAQQFSWEIATQRLDTLYQHLLATEPTKR